MNPFARWFGGKKKLSRITLGEIRVEEKRLQIRENQHIAGMEKLDKEREEIFHQGAKAKDPVRRRIYARRFTQTSQRVNLVEREILRIGKELITIGRMRSILERRKGGAGAPILERLSDEDLTKLTVMLEDDKISEEVYLQKLDGVLGVVTDPAYESQEIGQEGLDVLKTWEKMDEGELEFDEGLKEAAGKKEEEKPQGEGDEARSAEPAV